MTEIELVKGDAPEWREFENEDYDPQAKVGSDDDALGQLITERSEAEEPFGIVINADPVEAVDPGLIKRLASLQIPTRLRRAARDEHKVGEKKKKHKKD